MCRFGAHSMIPRDQRVFTPANTFERLVAMAVERGKLGDLLIDQLHGTGPNALARVLQIIEQLPPAQSERLITPLRAIFLHGLLAAMHASRTTIASP